MSRLKKLAVGLTALWMIIVVFLLVQIARDVSDIAQILYGWQEFGIRQR